MTTHKERRARRACLLLALAAPLLIALAARWSPVHGGSYIIKETWLKYHATQGDSAVVTTNWFSLKGASRARILVKSDHSGTYSSGPDTQYVDSVTTVVLRFSNDSLYATNNATMTPSIGSAQGNNNAGIVLLNQDVTGANVLRPLSSIGGRVLMMYPHNWQGGTAAADPMNVIPCKSVRLEFTPFTRNTASGGASTQGLRTKGFNGLSVLLQAYYANP